MRRFGCGCGNDILMFARVDKVFLWLVAVIVILGTLFFISASFGVLAKNPEKFQGILFNQLVLGLGLGIIAFFVAIKISYKFWRKYALHIFIGSIILLLLVFVPGLGFRHAGALRWVSIGPISFQPAEFLKFASIIYFSAWLSWAKDKVGDFKFGLLPLFLSLGVIAFILFKQPDVKRGFKTPFNIGKFPVLAFLIQILFPTFCFHIKAL